MGWRDRESFGDVSSEVSTVFDAGSKGASGFGPWGALVGGALQVAKVGSRMVIEPLEKVSEKSEIDPTTLRPNVKRGGLDAAAYWRELGRKAKQEAIKQARGVKPFPWIAVGGGILAVWLFLRRKRG